ncbi:MAG TPA: MFS transporter [Verrucomicrobiota bacterium]|nr:MFS transporter [Verrucomicrobiota bacterium]
MNNYEDHKTRTLWFVGALHAFTHVYHVALMPLYLFIQKDFNLASVGSATLLVTVMMVSYFLPSYVMGVAADRWNRKKLLGWGLVINSLGFVLLSFAPNYPCAVAAMIFAGLGGSFYHPAATAMVARLFPGTTGKALGLTGIGASVGFFFGPIYTGWRVTTLAATQGDAAWRQPILELGVLGLIMAAVFAWLAKNEPPPPSLKQHAARTEKMFPTAALWLLFLSAALAFSLRDFTGASMGSLGSLFLQKARGWDAKTTGLALSLMFIASAVSNPLFGHLSDRGRIRWSATVMIVASVLVLAFPHLPAGWTIPAFAAYGFFLMASYPMVEAALMESVPDSVRGRVFGVFITVGGLLGNLSHWVVGAWVRHLGDSAYTVSGYFATYAVLAGMIIVSLIGLPCLHAIRRREHLDDVISQSIPADQAARKS